MDQIVAESFLVVCETGNVTAASRHLHLSQSALSRRVQQLEAEIGVELLVRTRRGVEPTEAGRLVLEECRAMSARYAALRRTITDHQDLRLGTVVIGAGATVTSALLPPLIAQFRAEHPAIRFIVKEAGSHQVVEDVAQGAVQLGVVTLPATHPQVDITSLVRDQIVLVARPDDSLGRRVRPADLQARRVIAFEPGSAIRRIVDRALATHGVDCEITMELRSVPTMLRMVDATGDIAFVSKLALPADTTLRTVAVQKMTITRSLGLATRHGLPLPHAAHAFVASLRRQLKATKGAAPAQRS